MSSDESTSGGKPDEEDVGLQNALCVSYNDNRYQAACKCIRLPCALASSKCTSLKHKQLAKCVLPGPLAFIYLLCTSNCVYCTLLIHLIGQVL